MGALYLIRHARPAVEGVLLGQSDPPLSERGREEARAALIGAKRQATNNDGLPYPISVYSSPLRRAIETAAFVAGAGGVTVLKELAEISMGCWDGRRWEEVERADPALAARKSADWYGVTPPGGESWSEFSMRVWRALDVVLCGGTPAAIVAHWAVNAVIAAKVTGVSPGQFRQQYCEVIALDV
jgi:broad specificity phosphatase PhoE